MNLVNLYQVHLERVSRSFAFCIPRLEEELRHHVSLAYLLFRVVDTIEDSQWSDREEQILVFQEFIQFIETNASGEELKQWRERFPLSVPDEEKLLLDDLELMLADLHSLPSEIQKMMKQGLVDMSRGMIHFSEKAKVGLKSIEEVNQYCFFVAGLVGELLTGLVLKRPLSLTKDKGMLLKSHHFGLFLQKINILKDQSKDESEGRFFVPERKRVLQSLKSDSDAAFAYILSIPDEHRDYKIFCAYCFFLALFAFPYIESSWLSRMANKIPRAVTEKSLKQVEASIDDNDALKELYEKHSHFLSAEYGALSEPNKTESKKELAWFAESYSRELPPEHLENLGMI